jgi:type I restriction enzyme S subunit
MMRKIMKKNWRYMKLSDICREVLYGYTAPATTKPTGIRLLRVTDIASGEINWDEVPFCEISSKDYKRYHLRVGDIVIARMGTIGVSAIIKEDVPAVAASYLIIHRVDPRIADAKFISYLLHSRYYWEFIWSHGSSGAVQPNINAKTLGEFQFPLPPLPEQRAIAHILGTLDDKIELNRKMNETLEQMARALFKSWFIDFEPVRAKMEGRWKKGQSLPGLPAHLYDLFPDRLVDSKLGPIPEGWEVKKLSDICSTQYGYTASAIDNPIGPKLLRVTDINKQHWIDWSQVPHCKIDKDNKEVYALHVGDLVVARMADPGKAAIIEEEIDAVFASYLVRLKTESLAHSYYIIGFLKSDLYADYVSRTKSGSVQASMNAKVIVGAELVIPPIKLREKYLEVILPLRKQLVANIRESCALATLRDALLPKLISGELEIKEVKKIMEEYYARNR